LKAVLFALGSRGDIEPLLSLGEILRKKKWSVVYVFPEQFRNLIEDEGASFYGFTKEFIEVLLASDQSKIITSRKGSVIHRFKTLLSLAKQSIRINKEVTLQQKTIIDAENPDYVFYNQKCVYPIVWGMQNENKSVFVHPFPCFLHTVDQHSIIDFSGGGQYGKYLNRFSYFMQSHILSIASYYTCRQILKSQDRFKTNPYKIRRHLLKEAKSIYTISPSLFERPSQWPANAQLAGFVERDKQLSWQPSAKLSDFFETHKDEKILFISFGSISNTNPEAKTRAILNTIKKYKLPTIVNTSWGGLLELKDYPEHILFVQDIPYDWVFPRVYAVIHHGGAGTTHSAIKYGCASLIIPHFIDQFFWSKRIVDLELGPQAVSIKKLNEENFEFPLRELIYNRKFKINAEDMADKMLNEFNEDDLMNLI